MQGTHKHSPRPRALLPEACSVALTHPGDVTAELHKQVRGCAS